MRGHLEKGITHFEFGDPKSVLLSSSYADSDGSVDQNTTTGFATLKITGRSHRVSTNQSSRPNHARH